MSSASLLSNNSFNGLGTTHKSYSSCLSKFLGVCRILLGLTLVVHWITELVLYRIYVKNKNFGPTEVWIQAATFLILSGAAGCVAANRKNTASIMIHMALSLMSVALFGITKLFVSGVDLSNVFSDVYTDKERRAIVAVYGLSIGTSFLGCIFDLWAFGISYSAIVSIGTPSRQ